MARVEPISRKHKTAESAELKVEGSLNLKSAIQELTSLGVSPDDLVMAEELEVGGEGLSGRVKAVDWRLRREGHHAYRAYVGHPDDASVELDKRVSTIEKKESYKGITEADRAQQFWKSRLDKETLIEHQQHPNCEFAIVVPVFREDPARILKQIDSLRNQDIDPSSFEIIYIVNNDVLDETQRSKEAVAANQIVIAALKKIQGINVFVIDKSSVGNEIPNCNVGKARNRGVAEASYRFYQNSKNGILIQSDADTYFEDPTYLSRLRDITKKDPDIIGIAGGLIWEFSPDTNDSVKIADLRRKVDRFNLTIKWGMLVHFLREPDQRNPASKQNFSGAHMISRSYESAVIGGLIDANAGEDPQFGLDLETHAAGRGQKVVGMRSELTVITALRESDRTAASFKKDFDSIDLSRPLMVSDPFISETLPEFREKIYRVLEQSVNNPNELRQLLSNENGALIVSERAFTELIENVRKYGARNSQDFYDEWGSRNFGTGFNIMEQLYDAKHPQIPLTEDNYQRLIQKILKEPEGQDFIEKLNKQAEVIRMPH